MSCCRRIPAPAVKQAQRLARERAEQLDDPQPSDTLERLDHNLDDLRNTTDESEER